MAVRSCVLLLLVDVALPLRRSAHKSDDESSNKAAKIACPVMGALVNQGVIKMDGTDRVSQEDTLKGLMWTGNSEVMAGFQAKGITAFKANDTHQEYRERDGSYEKPLYLNYNTWNPLFACIGNNPTRNGLPCNVNVGFQQHGYSTTLRDPTDKSTADVRWSKWMSLPGVLTSMSGVNEKVMKLEGMGKLLKEARLRGEKSGEFSLTANNQLKGSPIAFYHPSARTQWKYLGCSQWQAMGAWAAFWALFARKKNGVEYMPESDLRRFFFHAQFPVGWKPKPWGFRETMKVVRELKGTGAGDVWADVMTGVLAEVGENKPDDHYAAGMLQALEDVGARDDDVFKRFAR